MSSKSPQLCASTLSIDAAMYFSRLYAVSSTLTRGDIITTSIGCAIRADNEQRARARVVDPCRTSPAEMGGRQAPTASDPPRLLSNRVQALHRTVLRQW